MSKKKRTQKVSLKKLYDHDRSFTENAGRLAKRILLQKQTPEEIASGFALGLFLAFAAPPGMQLLPAAAIASVMRWNVLAAVSAVFVSNPVTMPFIYPLAAYIGSYATGITVRGTIPLTDERFWAYATDMRLHGRVILLLLVGCVLLGSVAAMVGYYLSRWLVVIGRQILRERSVIRAYMDMSDPTLEDNSDPNEDSDPE